MGTVTTVHVSVVLSVICLVVVFAGGWYLQSSLIQLNTQVMEQHYHNQEQTKQIEELNEQLEQLNIIIDVLRNGKVSRMKNYQF